MKLRYIGPDIGVMTLTNNKIYAVLGIEDGMFRVMDDDPNEPGGYLYDPVEPGEKGRWEVVEDDAGKSLANTIRKYTEIRQRA